MTRRSLTASLIVLAATVSVAPGADAGPPTLTGFYPAGGRRGQSVTVEAAGSFDHWPVKCRVEGPGLSIQPDKEKGKLRIDVAADALPGVRWIRVHDDEGATSLRPFLIGVLPEVVEAEPNGDPRRPQAVGAPRVVVNGRLSQTEDVDGFSIKLTTGERLTADLEAHRNLGSPMDGVLQIVSADGFVLAQNNDAVGLDPRIVFDAPATGDYIVRTFAFPSDPNSSIHFSGSPAYVYRLTITTGGFIEHSFPLAVVRGHPTEIRLIGSNIADAEAALTVPPDDERLDVKVLTSPALAGAAVVRRVTGPALVESEPNEPSQPQVLPDGGSVSGRIDPPGDRDAYKITLKKGEPRLFRVDSRSFGLPLDAVIQIFDAAGKVVAELDDVGAVVDPMLAFAPPADGEYRVVVDDLNRRGGPRHAYLLSATAPEPDFHLTLPNDVFSVAAGGLVKITVAIAREHGFNDVIEATAEGLPDGVVATPARSRPGDDSAKSVSVEIKADGRPPRAGAFRIVARAADGKGRARTARAKINGLEADTEHPWLTVLPAPPAKSK